MSAASSRAERRALNLDATAGREAPAGECPKCGRGPLRFQHMTGHPVPIPPCLHATMPDLARREWHYRCMACLEHVVICTGPPVHPRPVFEDDGRSYGR